MYLTLMEPGARTAFTAESLPDHPLFEGMIGRHRHILAQCAMPANFEPGETIVETGEPASCFYLVINGLIGLECPGAPSVLRVQTIGSGDILGWSWLFSPYYWHFNASAEIPTEAILLYGSRLRRECDRDHDFGYELFRRMSSIFIARLQATREKWIEAAQLNPPLPGVPADYLII